MPATDPGPAHPAQARPAPAAPSGSTRPTPAGPADLAGPATSAAPACPAVSAAPSGSASPASASPASAGHAVFTTPSGSTRPTPIAPADPAGPAAPAGPGAGPLSRRRAGSAVPVRWALAGVLAVFCAVTGVAAGLAGCGLRSTVLTGPPPVRQARAIAGSAGSAGQAASAAQAADAGLAPARAAVGRWLAAASQLWLHRDAAAFDRLTTGSMRRVYRDAQHAATAGRRVPLRLAGLVVAVPCQTDRASVFVAYARTDAFAPGRRPVFAALVFTRQDRTWRLAAAVTSRTGQWPALCQALNPCVGPAVLPPPAYPRFLAHELTRSGAGRIRYFPGAAPVLALPLARGRGYWVLATVTGHGPRGARSAAVYAAIDPALAAGGRLTRSASLGGRK